MKYKASQLPLSHTHRSLRILRYFMTSWGMVLMGAVFVVPFLLLLSGFLTANADVLRTIFSSVFATFLMNTGILMVFVVLGSAGIGTITAWLVTQYQFPFRSALAVLLPLSLVISPYMRSIVFAEYADRLSFVIIPYFREYLPSLAPFVMNWFNVPFLIITLVLSLYPYVYFFVSAAYLRTSHSLFDSARLLNGHHRLFWSMGVPLAKTAIVGSTTLIVLDVLNEYAAVTYFGFPTISSAVYRTWFSYNSLPAAQVLSVGVLAVVIPCMWYSHRKQHAFQYDARQYVPLTRTALPRAKSIAALCCCGLPVALGFAVPVAQFIRWAFLSLKVPVGYTPTSLLYNTMLIVLVSVAVASVAAVAVSFSHHMRHDVPLRTGMFHTLYGKIHGAVYAVMNVGYAIPGAIVAIAVLSAVYMASRAISLLYPDADVAGMLMSKSMTALIFAFIVRFFFVPSQLIFTGFHNYGSRYEHAARSLGASVRHMFWKISLPLNLPFIVSGMLLFVVEILKEIPMTLMLRPFNFDTLSIKTYLLAKDEMILQSAVPMLLTVGIGLLCMACFYYSEWNVNTKRSLK